MEGTPDNAAALASDWGGRREYARDGLVGERLGLLTDAPLSELPWDSAPKDPSGAADGVVLVKRSHTRSVLSFLVPGPEGTPVRVYAKRHRARNFLKASASLFRRSKSWREWDLGWRALRTGLPVAAPLAWAERKRRGLVIEDYLITLGVDRSVSFRELWRNLPTSEERSLWAKELGRFIRFAHDRGCVHDDLSAKHILVAAGEPLSGSTPTFHFIDLDQSRLVRRVSPYRRAHNFFQVFRSLPSETFTFQERLAFYKGYSDGKWREEHIEAFQWAIQWIGRLKRLSKILKPRKWPRRRKGKQLRKARRSKE
ncbi:MAG TPA: lipopolysaccharide kinase InaA family protein [Sumerlaeia bacterium]|nr:lipopolysaccharide kinase InaA family protein [Sumerlaeia bacterium]